MARMLRLGILVILGLLIATSAVLLVMIVGKAVLPLALIGATALIAHTFLRGPIIIRTRSGKE